MTLTHLGTSLKIPSQKKSGSCICNHSPTAISTSSLLWNWWPPKCCFRGPNEWMSDRARSLIHLSHLGMSSTQMLQARESYLWNISHKNVMHERYRNLLFLCFTMKNKGVEIMQQYTVTMISLFTLIYISLPLQGVTYIFYRTKDAHSSKTKV
jgi:hypothetical protein